MTQHMISCTDSALMFPVVPGPDAGQWLAADGTPMVKDEHGHFHIKGAGKHVDKVHTFRLATEQDMQDHKARSLVTEISEEIKTGMLTVDALYKIRDIIHDPKNRIHAQH